MSIDFTVFDATGRHVKSMAMPDLENAELNTEPGHHLVEGYFSAAFYMDTATSAVIAMPPRPSDTAVFDHELKAWVEPFTPEELRDQRREVAVLDRYVFCARCLEQGILSRDDAVALSHGNIPPATRAILDTMDPADSTDAEMLWSGMMTVRRLDPLIIATMAATGIPEIMLDHLFDVFPYQAPEVTP